MTKDKKEQTKAKTAFDINKKALISGCFTDIDATISALLVSKIGLQGERQSDGLLWLTVTIAELGHEFRYAQAQVSQAIKKLEQCGFLKKKKASGGETGRPKPTRAYALTEAAHRSFLVPEKTDQH